MDDCCEVLFWFKWYMRFFLGIYVKNDVYYKIGSY